MMTNRQFKITPEIAWELFREAMIFANHIHVDELPEGSMRRRTSAKGIYWAMNHIMNSPKKHWTCIERNSFDINHVAYFEFTMSTMCSETEYFLWIHVPVVDAELLITKYNLTQLI